MVGQFFGEKLRAVHAAPHAPSPIHWYGNEAIGCEIGQFARFLKSEQLTERPSQKLSARMFHGEDRVAEDAAIVPQRDNRIEVELGLGAVGTGSLQPLGWTWATTCPAESLLAVEKALPASIAQQNRGGGHQVCVATGASRREKQVHGPPLDSAENSASPTNGCRQRSTPPTCFNSAKSRTGSPERLRALVPETSLVKGDGYRGSASLLWSDPDCTTILSSTPFSCKGSNFRVPSRLNQGLSGIVVADVAYRIRWKRRPAAR